ncbi:hypothetical protein BJ875DRAFT_481715 [Amylocarpus encephaloides]|uniref:Uncharacterized protein n=1 Tax=Amylocarpus encephaloides TaxID=45428 RepID=A0A9P7YNA6_9HELO|nr:hypothetical protein BJ875DRAFT_481715 [Amylocarpus encephaloides]
MSTITTRAGAPCPPGLASKDCSGRAVIAVTSGGVCKLNGEPQFAPCPDQSPAVTVGSLFWGISVTDIELWSFQIPPLEGQTACFYCGAPSTSSSSSGGGGGVLTSTPAGSPSTLSSTSLQDSTTSPPPQTGRGASSSTSARTTSPPIPSQPGPSTVPDSAATTTASLLPTVTSTSHRVSSGAAAGIGVGCLLAGTLIAGLIAFLLFRRKKNTEYSGQHPYGAGYVASDKGGLMGGDSPISGGAALNINRLLPQPAEDAAIIGGLSKIRDDIKNHAQNYYHNDAIRPELVDETEVLDLAHAISAPPSAVRGLFLNPGTRTDAIRLFLAQLILSSCTGTSDLRLSLLPREISAFTANLSANDAANAIQAALFSKWKTISGVLLQREYGSQIRDHDSRIENINRVVAIADSVLQPFMDSRMDMMARRRHLEATIRRASQFAFLLFSQPASFHFDYTGTGRRDNLLVFPALLQTVNDEAEVLSPPRVLSEREVVTDLIF